MDSHLSSAAKVLCHLTNEQQLNEVGEGEILSTLTWQIWCRVEPVGHLIKIVCN